jgi:hypothetical protein
VLIAVEGGEGARVQGDETGLAELGVAHHEQPPLDVEVFTLEAHRFAASHPGDGEQTDERFERRRSQRVRLGSGGSQQRRHFLQ